MTSFPFSLLLIVPFIIFLTTAWLKQKALDTWRRETGRAPVTHVSKRAYAGHMQAVMLEVPVSLRKKIVLFDWVAAMTWLFSMLAIAIIIYVTPRR